MSSSCRVFFAVATVLAVILVATFHNGKLYKAQDAIVLLVSRDVFVGVGPGIPKVERKGGNWFLNVAVTPAPWPIESAEIRPALRRGGRVAIQLKGSGIAEITLVNSAYPDVFSMVFASKEQLAEVARFIGYPVDQDIAMTVD